MQQQINFLDLPCGKTSLGPSVQPAEKTSAQSSSRSVPSAIRPVMFLDLRMGYGNLLGAYWETTTVLPGGHTTRSSGECPSVVRESTLSQILDLNAPEKYCLSATACAGIVRRAQKRGKQLPDMLRDALMEVINQAGGLEMIDEDSPEQEEDFDDEEDE